MYLYVIYLLQNQESWATCEHHTIKKKKTKKLKHIPCGELRMHQKKGQKVEMHMNALICLLGE